MKKHPLTAAMPNRSQEEIESVANAEGLVSLSEDERGEICTSVWFKSRPAGHRALMATSMYEWAEGGMSPRTAARIAGDLLQGAAHA